MVFHRLKLISVGSPIFGGSLFLPIRRGGQTSHHRCIILYCFAFLYLSPIIKIVNSTNKDRVIPHLHQNMERQTKLKVLAH